MTKVTTKITITSVFDGFVLTSFIFQRAARENIAFLISPRIDTVILETNAPRSMVDMFIKDVAETFSYLGAFHTDVHETISKEIARTEVRLDEHDLSNLLTVPIDTAICPACAEEILTKDHPKAYYAHTNCVVCGARFSITHTLPFKREHTTYEEFSESEADAMETRRQGRRFRLQTNASEETGPVYTLYKDADTVITNKQKKAVKQAAKMLKRGKVIALSAVGGYYLAALPYENDTVKRMRSIKREPTKPFALMVRSIAVAKAYCELDDRETAMLTSPLAPIVIAQRRKRPAVPANRMIASAVSPNMKTLGILFPHTPLLRLLAEEGLDALILTSGNKNDRPIVTGAYDMMKTFEGEVDAFLTTNLKTAHMLDDSVIRYAKGDAIILQRSRGFVPYPIILPKASAKRVLAVGGDIKNTFTMVEGDTAFVSQCSGDLSSISNFYALQQNIKKFRDLLDFQVEAIAGDMQKNYFSSQYATHLAGTFEQPFIPVQHHIAHAAALVAERNVHTPIAVFTFDEGGYGFNGELWGGEVITYNGVAEFAHKERMRTFLLPGGDRTTKEIYRLGISLLHNVYGENVFSLKIPFVQREDYDDVIFQLVNHFNSPVTSSAGKFFDGIYAILSLARETTYEGEARHMLEMIADASETGYLAGAVDVGILDFRPLVMGIVEEMSEGTSIPVIAARFVNSVARMLTHYAKTYRDSEGMTLFGFSGSVFENVLLVRKLHALFEEEGLQALFHKRLPTNDECLSVGQAYVAMNEVEQME